MRFRKESIKFTDQGNINITFDFDDQESFLKFEVTDTGIGMSESQILKIFSEFEQAENNTSTKYGGTGLGLPICEKIINMLNGKIYVNSEIGRGSTFRVEVPTKIVSKKLNNKFNVIENIKKSIPPKTSILLAEDNKMNQTIFTKLLSEHKLTAEVVENGLLAVREMEKNDYQLIFLDIRMPHLDGIEACRRIRSLEKYKETNQPWIIALTANTFADDIELYRQAGFDDFAPKPFNRKTIETAMTNFIHRQGCFSSSNKNKAETISLTKLINKDLLQERLDIGLEVSGDLLEKLDSSVYQSLDQIKQAITHKNFEAIYEGAHLAKGTCFGYGMEFVGRQFENIEKGSKSKSLDLNELPDLLKEIERKYSRSRFEVLNYIDKVNKAS